MTLVKVLGHQECSAISSVESVSLTKLTSGTEKLFDIVSNVFHINFKSQEFCTL